MSSDNDKGQALKFTRRYSTTQFVRTRNTISNAAVKKKPTPKKEKEETDDDKGKAYSMEDHLNIKDFHLIISIKLASREKTP
jgi:hypothetical protein